MDINMQIKILENLLKKEENRECSDCNSKNPRWASITFGTFVCLRCSGMHRQLQVHITKIKSVNLDKWPPGMVEMYQYVNNAMLNSYWEARLPQGFQKPGVSATSYEVESFIKGKYVEKKWVDTSMNADPAYLYWHDKNKFEKYIDSIYGVSSEQQQKEEDAEKKRKDEKKQKKIDKRLQKERSKQSDQVQQQSKQKSSEVVENLICLDSLVSEAPKQNLMGIDLCFTEIQAPQPVKQMDLFQDLQVNQNQQSQSALSTNMKTLMSLYNQNPGLPNNANNKFSTFDQMGQFKGQGIQQQTFTVQQNQFQQSPTYQQPNFNNFNALNFQQQQQQVRPPTQFQQQPVNIQQTNLFQGLNMTINVNQYGQQQQQQQQQLPIQQNLQQNHHHHQHYNSANPQTGAKQLNFDFTMPQQQQPQHHQSMYGQHHNSSNMFNPVGNGLGSFNGMGANQQNAANHNNGQRVDFQVNGSTHKQTDAFGGLMSGQWH